MIKKNCFDSRQFGMVEMAWIANCFGNKDDRSTKMKKWLRRNIQIIWRWTSLRFRMQNKMYRRAHNIAKMHKIKNRHMHLMHVIFQACVSCFSMWNKWTPCDQYILFLLFNCCIFLTIINSKLIGIFDFAGNFCNFMSKSTESKFSTRVVVHYRIYYFVW